jgi:hypothetical protein
MADGKHRFSHRGKKRQKKLPDIDGLYDKYVLWGLIQENEKMEGGILTFMVDNL